MYNSFSGTSPRLNYILLYDGRSIINALESKLAQVDGLIGTRGDELAEAAADCRRLLQAVSGEAIRHEQIAHLGVLSNEGIVVKQVHTNGATMTK